ARLAADGDAAGVGTGHRRDAGGTAARIGARAEGPAAEPRHPAAAAATSAAAAASVQPGQADTGRPAQTGAATARPEQGQQQPPAHPALRVAALGAGEPSRRTGGTLPDRMGLSAARSAGGDRAGIRYMAADPGPGRRPRLGPGSDADGAPQLCGDRRGPYPAP